MAADPEVKYRERACSVYRDVACLPVPATGRVFSKGKGRYDVEVHWTQRDLERGKNLSFAKNVLVSVGDGGVEELMRSAFQYDITAM